MATLTVPTSGLKLSQLPVARPSDPYKRDKIPQAVILDLSRDGMDRLLKSCRAGDGVDVAASLGARSMVEMITKTAGGKHERQEIPSRSLEKSLVLCDNGFVYRIDDASEQASLQSRLDLRIPQKRSGNDEQDAGLMALTKGLSDANAQKQSHRTTLADPNASRRRKGFRSSMVAAFGGLKGHRENLFGHSKQSSLTTSPLLGGHSPLLGNSEKDRRKARLEEAKKRALMHLLAVRPVSESQMAKLLRCPLSDIQHLIRKHGQPSRSDSSKFELNDLGYKNIDPWSFGYSDEDRSLVIDRAIEAFDRKRFGKTDKAWDMLLPKHDRGKGKGSSLSKLANKMLTVESNAQPTRAPDARSTPVPEINVSEAGSPPHGGKATSSEMTRKRSSSDSANGDAHDRTAKRAKQGPDAREKRLFQSASQREREKAKERAKEMKKLESRATPASATSSPRVGAKKPAASRSSAAVTAAANTSALAKVKSSEFVTESDDEEAEAVVKKAQAAQSPKPAASKAPPKVTAKPTVSAKSAAAKSSSTTTSTPASTTTTTTLDKPKATSNGRSVEKPSPSKSDKSSKPSAWDFSVNKKPAASTLNRPSAKSATAAATAASSSRPSTPSGAIVQQHRQVKSNGAGRTGAASAAMARTGSNAASAPTAKPAARPAEKPASQRTDLMRKLDSAKRPSGSSDSRAARPSGLKASSAGSATGANSIRNDRATGSSSSNGRSAGFVGSPGRSSEFSRSQPMSKTFSHQRKSSQPLQPSPLAASPPINLADIEETARGSRASLASKTLPKKATGSAAVTDNRAGNSSSSSSSSSAARPVKRKADDIDVKASKAGTSTTVTGPSSSSTSSTGAERPAKRRETGTAASLSNGAGQSKAGSSRQSDGSASLKARRYSQEDSGNGGGSSNNGNGGGANGNKSHSPSPASSTIGSTSTKDTSMSLHSNSAGNKDRGGTDIRSGNAKGASSVINSAHVKANTSSGTAAASKGASKFNGIKHSELERMARFEEQREQYNRKQREVAAMEHPPIEKVRELNRLFHSLETQKKVFAAL